MQKMESCAETKTRHDLKDTARRKKKELNGNPLLTEDNDKNIPKIK